MVLVDDNGDCVCYGSGTCSDTSKHLKLTVMKLRTWTYNIVGDDGSNDYIQEINVNLVVKMKMVRENILRMIMQNVQLIVMMIRVQVNHFYL